MLQSFLLTFDLENATPKDYKKVGEILESFGFFADVTLFANGELRQLPTTTFFTTQEITPPMTDLQVTNIIAEALLRADIPLERLAVVETGQVGIWTKPARSKMIDLPLLLKAPPPTKQMLHLGLLGSPPKR